MFFPKMRPADIAGQSLKLAATFLGVAMVTVDGAVFSGPLFRDGAKVFVLHAEQEGDGNAILRVLDIGDRAGSEVLDQKANIDYLMARIKDDAGALETLRSQNTDLREILKRQENDNAQLLELVKTANDNCDGYVAKLELMKAALNAANARSVDLNARAVDLNNSLTAINAERVELANSLAIAEGTIQRYTDIVGPLDPPARGINDEIAEQLKLMEAEEPPAPPPVVAGDITVSNAAPGSEDALESILREGSVQDYAFRRLMFLTRGEKSL